MRYIDCECGAMREVSNSGLVHGCSACGSGVDFISCRDERIKDLNVSNFHFIRRMDYAPPRPMTELPNFVGLNQQGHFVSEVACKTEVCSRSCTLLVGATIGWLCPILGRVIASPGGRVFEMVVGLVLVLMASVLYLLWTGRDYDPDEYAN